MLILVMETHATTYFYLFIFWGAAEGASGMCFETHTTETNTFFEVSVIGNTPAFYSYQSLFNTIGNKIKVGAHQTFVNLFKIVLRNC